VEMSWHLHSLASLSLVPLVYAENHFSNAICWLCAKTVDDEGCVATIKDFISTLPLSVGISCYKDFFTSDPCESDYSDTAVEMESCMKLLRHVVSNTPLDEQLQVFLDSCLHGKVSSFLPKEIPDLPELEELELKIVHKATSFNFIGIQSYDFSDLSTTDLSASTLFYAGDKLGADFPWLDSKNHDGHLKFIDAPKINFNFGFFDGNAERVSDDSLHSYDETEGSADRESYQRMKDSYTPEDFWKAWYNAMEPESEGEGSDEWDSSNLNPLRPKDSETLMPDSNQKWMLSPPKTQIPMGPNTVYERVSTPPSQSAVGSSNFYPPSIGAVAGVLGGKPSISSSNSFDDGQFGDDSNAITGEMSWKPTTLVAVGLMFFMTGLWIRSRSQHKINSLKGYQRIPEPEEQILG